MPNFGKHAAIGLLVGIGFTVVEYYVQKEEDPDVKFDKGILLLNSAAAVTGAILPDKIEPAAHPNHRGLFHSVFSAAAMLWVLNENRTSNPNPVFRTLISCLGYGYLSHLAADFTTPRSLPLI